LLPQESDEFDDDLFNDASLVITRFIKLAAAIKTGAAF
jgi:hypothetical protein